MEALLSLGGNMGDRKALADEAIARLSRLPHTIVTAQSSYYRTEPVGPVAQSWFLNLAVMVHTELSVAALVAACRAIETELGRDRANEISWGPRPIDIDVVAFREAAKGAFTARDKIDRAFVLVPLAEIAREEWIEGERIIDMASAVDRAGVSALDWGKAGHRGCLSIPSEVVSK
jgi:2-amino-4-hydroxy-6-hydroxymethyldihydropteridine diphosphokinase